MLITTIVGARPQFIKLAPLSEILRCEHEEVILHTGQHYDDALSEQFFRDLNLPEANFNLNIGSGTHGLQTGKMLEGIEQVLQQVSPDLVITFGDTNSTLAGALTASKLHIPTVHIEAGLRSFNRGMPEEINRVGADHFSDILFAPTEIDMKNLQNEGLESRAHLTGDIMVDTLKDNLGRASERHDTLKMHDLNVGEYYLLTLHRPSNVDEPTILKNILSQLNQLDYPLLFPLHPRTQKTLNSIDTDALKNIRFAEPLGYLDFLSAQCHSRKIITDSGGVQKEAYLLNKPCITLRTETEWVETVDAGWNLLLYPERDDLTEAIIRFNPTDEQVDIFGQGVAHKMVNIIHEILS
jgi:UDP-N-acetylglucosamine 2-epimerase